MNAVIEAQGGYTKYWAVYIYAVIYTFLVNKWTFFFFGYILIAKIVVYHIVYTVLFVRRGFTKAWRRNEAKNEIFQQFR